MAIKKLSIVSFIVIILSCLAFQTSPYARRIRPFVSTPSSCQENEIGYNMTSHSILICTNSGYQVLATGGSGSFAPVGAKYIVQTADGTLTNEQALGALSTGILKNTTTTGILSIGIAGDVNSILPTQTGNSGRYLTTNGTVSSWNTISTGIANSASIDVIPITTDGSGNLGSSLISQNSGNVIFTGTNLHFDVGIDNSANITTLGAGSKLFISTAATAGHHAGELSIEAGSDTGDGDGGKVVIASGFAANLAGNSGTGGDIVIKNGSGIRSDWNGGDLFLEAGNSLNGHGGSIILTPGNSTNGAQGETVLYSANGSIYLSVSNDNIIFRSPVIQISATITSGGTTGAQTIDKSAGSVNFAATDTSLVVTNSTVAANSVINCTVQTNDTTLKSVQCVPTSGSFTMFANAAATAETRVAFTVITPQ